MHRLPSRSAVRRIRLAALLLGGKHLLTPAAVALLAWSFAAGNREVALIGLGMLVLAGLVVILQWIIATRANCPLCLTPVLGTKHCAKHRSARSLLGSHRLLVAVTVLLMNRFRCPYCGESSVLKVRPRKHR